MNPLDILARGIFHMLGMDGSPSKGTTTPKAKPQPINARGQTNLFTKAGKTRNFRNPAQSAQRAPTLSPVKSGPSPQATPPARPSAGFGQAPGQLSIFGKNPNAVPGGKFKAPNVPNKLAIAAGGTAGAPLLGTAAKSLLGAGALFSILEGIFPASTADGTLKGKPTRYSGMEDTSGDPLIPLAQSQRAAADKEQGQRAYRQGGERTGEAYIGTGVPSPRTQPTTARPARQAAPARKPSRKELTIKKYDDLRAQFNAGKITNEQFVREGLKMHKEFFNK